MKDENKKGFNINILIGVAGLLIGLFLISPLAKVQPKPIKNYQVETLDGDKVNLDDYKGEKLMLFFYSTDCPYCIQAIPVIEDLDEEELGINILMVNMIQIERDIDNVVGIRDELDMKHTIVLDEDAIMSDDFQVSGTPTQVFIDEEGFVISSVPGLLQTDSLVEIIKGLE